MLILSYYEFGVKAVKAAKKVLENEGDIIDAVEKGINVIEEDPTIKSVGIGGIPNLEGNVELDAAIMDGRTLRCGSVAAVKRIKYPISLARKVMEYTPHVMIVGDNALKLARIFGMEELDLPLKESYEEYLKRKSKLGIEKYNRESIEKLANSLRGHDTIGLIAYKDGDFAAGMSSSGLALKVPGRVGDSPIIGAGLYASKEGAAICTGLGEIAIRLVAAKTALDLIREGYTPQESVEKIISEVNSISKRENIMYSLGIVIVDKELRIGAAANYDFKYVYWNSEETKDVILKDARKIPM